MKKLTVCTRYTRLGASSRLRFYDYAPLLKAEGIETDIHPLLGDSYIKKLYAGKKSRISGSLSLAKRMAQAPFWGNELLIEYELLPFLPINIEKLLLNKRRYVLAFDDAVWMKYRGIRRLDGKFEELARHASGIISANDTITSHLAPYNSNIIKIPTAVDVNKYLQAQGGKDEKFTVAWIGTPVTCKECLLPFAGMLKAAARKLDFKLLVIASRDLPPIDGVDTETVDWSLETEAMLLKRAHIGIMPLPEDDFMRGKSAYKLIQYLASGLPCIASPVGENKVLLAQKEVGFSAATEDEWCDRLLRLAADAELRSKLSSNALELAQEYSISHHAKRMAEFLTSAFGW